jgi:hypothetical protein
VYSVKVSVRKTNATGLPVVDDPDSLSVPSVESDEDPVAPVVVAVVVVVPFVPVVLDVPGALVADAVSSEVESSVSVPAPSGAGAQEARARAQAAWWCRRIGRDDVSRNEEGPETVSRGPL